MIKPRLIENGCTNFVVLHANIQFGFPVFQTAAWLTETSSTSEDLGQHLSDPFALTALLAHHRQLENLSSGEFNRIFFYLHPLNNCAQGWVTLF